MVHQIKTWADLLEAKAKLETAKINVSAPATADEVQFTSIYTRK